MTTFHIIGFIVGVALVVSIRVAVSNGLDARKLNKENDSLREDLRKTQRLAEARQLSDDHLIVVSIYGPIACRISGNKLKALLPIGVSLDDAQKSRLSRSFHVNIDYAENGVVEASLGSPAPGLTGFGQALLDVIGRPLNVGDVERQPVNR